MPIITGKMIIAPSGLNRDEVEKMRREADAYAADDTRKKEEVETKNIAEATVYSAEKTIRDYGDNISVDLKSEVEGKIAATRSALQGTDINYIKSALQALNDSMQKIGATVTQTTPKVVMPFIEKCLICGSDISTSGNPFIFDCIKCGLSRRIHAQCILGGKTVFTETSRTTSIACPKCKVVTVIYDTLVFHLEVARDGSQKFEVVVEEIVSKYNMFIDGSPLMGEANVGCLVCFHLKCIYSITDKRLLKELGEIFDSHGLRWTLIK